MILNLIFIHSVCIFKIHGCTPTAVAVLTLGAEYMCGIDKVFKIHFLVYTASLIPSLTISTKWILILRGNGGSK